MPITVHTADVVLPVTAEPLDHGAVAVDGERIVAVGPIGEVLGRYAEARVRSWRGVLTPGLVNAHAHLQYTDFAELASSGLPFPAWLVEMNVRRLTFDDARWQASTRRGLHLAVATGTTAVADVVTNTCVLGPTARSGLQGISYVEAVAVDDATWPAHRARCVALLDAPPAGRAVGMSPHTLYTIGTAVFRDCVGLARARGLRTHTHLAESAAEAEYVLTGTGPFADAGRDWGLDLELIGTGTGVSPTAHLDALGGLGSDVHVAHGVHVDAADRATLRERRSVVALCTRSNAILAAGEAPVAAYLAEDNPIAIGTDSLASSPDLDLFAEAAATRALARRQGADGSRYAGLDRHLVEAATLGGARAMGLTDVGELRTGARADLAVFDVPTGADDPHADPYRSLLDHGAGRCAGTVLGGRIVHRRGPA